MEDAPPQGRSMNVDDNLRTLTLSAGSGKRRCSEFCPGMLRIWIGIGRTISTVAAPIPTLIAFMVRGMGRDVKVIAVGQRMQ